MERPKNLSVAPRTAIIIIILFHVVGLIGLSVPALTPIFLKIVPWHLLLMLVVIVSGHKYFDGYFLSFFMFIFLLGFLAEWIGVHKQWLFGSYQYGGTLGVKVFDIPLTIGLNWFLLVYATGVAMQRSRLKSTFFRIVTGAFILVALDLLIEPVAVRFDYWQWTNGVIPIKNYVCWFFVSAAMLYIFERFAFKKQNTAAPILLATQFAFFAFLNVASTWL